MPVSEKSLQKAFKQEFKELLEKYNVSIGFQVGECSDTYGLYDERMIVYHTIPNTYKTEDWLTVYGWELDNTDVK